VNIGTCKWFNEMKGYGFISPDEAGPDVFVHVSALDAVGIDTLSEGDRVEFTAVPGRDGRAQAANVRRLS
jgi:CspA family cold shock protein